MRIKCALVGLCFNVAKTKWHINKITVIHLNPIIAETTTQIPISRRMSLSFCLGRSHATARFCSLSIQKNHLNSWACIALAHGCLYIIHALLMAQMKKTELILLIGIVWLSALHCIAFTWVFYFQQLLPQYTKNVEFEGAHTLLPLMHCL